MPSMSRSPIKSSELASRKSTSKAVTQTNTKDEEKKTSRYDKCGKCQVLVKSEGVQCDDCKFWFRIKCCSVSDSMYKVLSSMEDFEWRCDECKLETRKMKDEIEKLKLVNENKILKERVAHLPDCRTW